MAVEILLFATFVAAFSGVVLLVSSRGRRDD
jgi:hypothetical protein